MSARMIPVVRKMTCLAFPTTNHGHVWHVNGDDRKVKYVCIMLSDGFILIAMWLMHLCCFFQERLLIQRTAFLSKLLNYDHSTDVYNYS